MTAITNLVSGGNDLPLGSAEKYLAVALAVKEYSKNVPRIVVEDVTGDSGFDYPLSSSLTYYSDGFSSIQSVEYAVDDTDETPDILQSDEWMIYQKPAGKVLRFLEDTPDTDESFRVTYTALHTCTDSACTVKDIDDEIVQMLSAAYFCEMLSTYYAQSTDSTIQADSVDHKSKAAEYAVRGRMYRKLYFVHLGIKEGGSPAVSLTKDWDKNASWGSDRLTHPRKWR